MNIEDVKARIAAIRDWFANCANYEEKEDWKAVIGISGGKDSSVAAALLTRAIGPEKVIGILMPNGEQKDMQDAIDLCKLLGIHWGVCNIDGPYVAMIAALDVSDVNIGDRERWWNPDKYECDPRVTTNLPARLRMCVLYAIANHINGRVIGTGNRSEALVGWTSLWGDSVCDIAVLNDLYVSEVIELGELLGLPERFTRKPPNDGMSGKTDEEKLGFTYDELENTVRFMSPKSQPVDPEKKARIHECIDSMRWKRELLVGIPSVKAYMEA